MALLPIKIPPGVVRGAAPQDTPGRWYDTNLIRWRGSVMEPVGGWQRASSSPLSEEVRRIHRFRNNSAKLRTLLFSTAKIYSYSADNGYVDVSPSDLASFIAGSTLPVGYGVGLYNDSTYGTPRAVGSELYNAVVPMWSVDNWGEDALAVSSADGRILYYDDEAPETDLTVVGVSSIDTIARATNVTTVTTLTPHTLASGDSVTIAGVTDTSFNATATATVVDANEFTYPNTGSDGSSSGGTVTNNTIPTGNRAVLVTPERHAMLMQEDGNPRRIAWCSREDFTDWRYSSTTNTAGFLDLEAKTPLYTAAKVRNGTLVFSETEVFHVRYVGQPFIFGADFLEETRIIGPRAVATDSGVAFWWSSDGFFKSDGSQVQPIPCPIWDYLCVVRCTLQAPSKLFASSHGTYPEIWFFYPSAGSAVADKYVIYNYIEDWWAIGELSRTSMAPALSGQPPLMTGADNHVYQHETGWTDDTNTARDGDIYAETSVINIPTGGERNFEIRQAMAANGFGTDSLRMTFYSNQTPMGSERTFGPYTPRADGYVDTRVTGRDVRIRVDALGDSDWNLGEIRLDVAAGARR